MRRHLPWLFNLASVASLLLLVALVLAGLNSRRIENYTKSGGSTYHLCFGTDMPDSLGPFLGLNSNYVTPEAILTALALAVLPTMWLLIRVNLPSEPYLPPPRSEGTWPSYCRRCGYDLRATPARCPECGAVSKSKKP